MHRFTSGWNFQSDLLHNLHKIYSVNTASYCTLVARSDQQIGFVTGFGWIDSIDLAWMTGCIDLFAFLSSMLESGIAMPTVALSYPRVTVIEVPSSNFGDPIIANHSEPDEWTLKRF